MALMPRRLGACLLGLLSPFVLEHPAFAAWQPNGVAVCNVAGGQITPLVVSDAQGGAYVVWEDARTLPAQIYAQHLNAVGDPLWAVGGIMVSSGTYSQTKPVAVGDGAGGVIVSWILEIVPGAREARGQRLNAAGMTLWAGGGIPFSPGPAFPVQLAIISDGRQATLQTPGVILAWTDIRNGSTTDIYAQAIDNAGVPRWNVAVCTAVDQQSELVMVTDGSGSTFASPRGAILAWRDGRVAGDDVDLYAQRLNSAGVPQWAADGVAVDAGGSGVQEPVIVGAGATNAIIAWPGVGPSRSYALWAQRVGDSGSWPGTGVLVAPPNGHQTGPSAIADGSGGILVSWSAFGAGLDRDLFAQRLNSTGAPVWAASGVSVSNVPGSQSLPIVVHARDQGAVIAWQDRRSLTDSDIYAQQMSSAGVALWNPGGVPLCVVPGNQYDVAAAPDTTGGAIVAWTDERSGSGTDIYAQRVTGWGGVVAVEPAGGSAGLELRAPFPNPTRTGVTFRYDLPEAREVTAVIFDVNGRRVRTLLAQQPLPAGAQTLAWNGEDDAQARVAPGVYWLSLRAGAEEGRRRAVLLRSEGRP
ncbi:MAG: FlgD immunoglobulin-like domain containing protein [Candidatus Eisenbacteria bacterium]